MKKITIAATACGLLLSCSTELELISTDLPPTVASAFNAKYPGATDVEWEAEKEDGHLVFEAEFEHGGDKKEATFKPDGTFIKEDND